MAGIVSPWGLDKAILALCTARMAQLVLAEAVRDEVEENLLIHAERIAHRAGSQGAPPASEIAEKLVDTYRRLIELSRPEIVPYPAKKLVEQSRHLIRHAADVPVLLSAMVSKPDWFLTHNTKHFTPTVAERTSLRIATPSEFVRSLSALAR